MEDTLMKSRTSALPVALTLALLASACAGDPNQPLLGQSSRALSGDSILQLVRITGQSAGVTVDVLAPTTDSRTLKLRVSYGDAGYFGKLDHLDAYYEADLVRFDRPGRATVGKTTFPLAAGPNPDNPARALYTGTLTLPIGVAQVSQIRLAFSDGHDKWDSDFKHNYPVDLGQGALLMVGATVGAQENMGEVHTNPITIAFTYTDWPGKLQGKSKTTAKLVLRSHSDIHGSESHPAGSRKDTVVLTKQPAADNGQPPVYTGTYSSRLSSPFGESEGLDKVDTTIAGQTVTTALELRQ
jgi:hypothetical protein